MSAACGYDERHAGHRHMPSVLVPRWTAAPRRWKTFERVVRVSLIGGYNAARACLPRAAPNWPLWKTRARGVIRLHRLRGRL